MFYIITDSNTRRCDVATQVYVMSLASRVVWVNSTGKISLICLGRDVI